MNWVILLVTLFCSNAHASFIAHGHLRIENGKVWLHKGHDVTEKLPATYACSSEALKNYLNMYVKLSWHVADHKKCFDVISISPAIYDPLKDGFRKYKRP